MYNKFREKMKETIEQVGLSDNEIKFFSDFFAHEYQECEKGFKLYRYMPATYDNIRNLEKEVICLSANGVMNDIYEGLPEFSQKDFTYKETKSLDDIMLMKCFSETKDNTLMWGHYADGAKGFCIEYDLSYINNSEKILEHIFPVVYFKNRFNNIDFKKMIEDKHYLDDEVYMDAEPDDHPWLRDIYYLFLVKGKKWKYEKEWRLLYSKYELYKNNLDWQAKRVIPFPYTSAVYLGAKIEGKYKEHITEIVNTLNQGIDIPRNNIKLYEMCLSDDKFTFKFNELQKNKKEYK